MGNFKNRFGNTISRFGMPALMILLVGIILAQGWCLLRLAPAESWPARLRDRIMRRKLMPPVATAGEEGVVFVKPSEEMAIIRRRMEDLFEALLPSSGPAPIRPHFAIMPRDDLCQLRNEISRIFDGMLTGMDTHLSGWEFPSDWDQSAAPAVKLQDLGDRYLLTIALPEVDRKNARIRLEDRTIVVEANRTAAAPFGNSGHRARSDRFETRIRLPQAVDVESATARHVDGLLEISVHKLGGGPPLAKRIPVR